ncbi:hypothetical protein CAI21_16400 [Alkalilimnicola ehrlichii]|uniref:Uncharacterized protein n=1 Tax=Alkalilimnicola ehrlichii TaxID=351052 RepID=A0A3E0WLX5_9GAMM|nr:hypothetical protein [Alkalilimnicola ehrlichii]RFA26552.1 hypothetical protein CAI21_16400 [Alkalilimnicola ehrlichii]RFA32945.1 hypothetical protein CAL65_18595 [Alkalilimnicola ehrlichii]
MQTLDRTVARKHHDLRRRQADMLAQVSSEDALAELTAVGLLPPAISRQASALIAERVDEALHRL